MGASNAGGEIAILSLYLASEELLTLRLANTSMRRHRTTVHPQVLTLITGSKETKKKYLWQLDKKSQRYAKDNRTAHLITRSDKSVAYVTNSKRLLDVLYCWS